MSMTELCTDWLIFDDSDKFPRTLFAIVVKGSSEHKKSTCKWAWLSCALIGWLVITWQLFHSSSFGCAGVLGCSGVFRCSEVFQCSGVFRCSAVLRCSGVPGFSTCRLDRFKYWRHAFVSDVPGSENKVLARYSETKWRTSIAERVSLLVLDLSQLKRVLDIVYAFCFFTMICIIFAFIATLRVCNSVLSLVDIVWQPIQITELCWRGDSIARSDPGNVG